MADMIGPNDIQPTAAPAAPAAPAATEAAAGSLPDELIQQPVMQALMAGSPPAASAKIPESFQTPLGQLVAKYGKDLQNAGFGFYRAQDGQYGVVFNSLRVNPQEIVQADQSGNLLEVAPPFEQIEQAIAADPAANPVLSAQAPGGAAQRPPPVAGQAGAVAAPRGKVQKALFQTRKAALKQEGPTSGPRPGGGRVLNAIMKPVI